VNNYSEFNKVLEDIQDLALAKVYNKLLARRQVLIKDVPSITDYVQLIQDLDKQHLPNLFNYVEKVYEEKEKKRKDYLDELESTDSRIPRLIRKKIVSPKIESLTPVVKELEAKSIAIKLELVREELLKRVSQKKAKLNEAEKSNANTLELAHLEEIEELLQGMQPIPQSEHLNTGATQTLGNNQKEDGSR